MEKTIARFYCSARFHYTIMKMEISILYHVIVNSQSNRDNLFDKVLCNTGLGHCIAPSNVKVAENGETKGKKSSALRRVTDTVSWSLLIYRKPNRACNTCAFCRMTSNKANLERTTWNHLAYRVYTSSLSNLLSDYYYKINHAVIQTLFA